MTDTTKLLKYAEGLTKEKTVIVLPTGDRIHINSEEEQRVGKVIKVLIGALESTKVGAAWDVKETIDAELARATAILGGNLKDKTDE